MRIHRIRLAGFRGVEALDVQVPERGVTVIEGPNESGKTSLAEAVDLAFEHPDSSTKSAVKALQPVHRDVGTEVEVELTTGPYRLVYEKQWNRQPRTVLRILQPEPAQLTGRDAHDRMRAILDETLDPALWRALQLQQGGAQQPELAASRSLLGALDAASAAMPAAEGEDTLWRRVEAERARWFTPTGQPNAERKQRAQRLAGEQAEAQRLAQEVLALDEVAEQHRTVGLDIERVRARLGDARRSLQQHRDAQRAVVERREAVARLERDAAEADRRRDAARAEDEQRAALIERTDRAEREVAAVGERLEPLRREVAGHESEVAAAVAARDAARGAHRAAEQAAADAQVVLHHHRAVAESEGLRDRVVVAEEAESVLREVAAVLEAGAPSADEVQDLEEDLLAWRTAEQALEAGSPTLLIRAAADTAIAVGAEQVALTAGERQLLRVPDRLRVVVGAVELEIAAGGGGARLRERAADAEQRFRARCRRLDLPVEQAVGAARRRLDDHALATRRHEDAAARLRAALGGGSVDLLRARAEALRAQTAPALAARPELASGSEQQAGAAVAAADGDVRRARAAERAAEDALTAAEGLLAAARSRLQQVEVSAGVLRDRADALRVALDDARSAAPDDVAAAQRRTAEVAAQDAARRLGAGRDALAALEPDAVDLLAGNAEQVVEGLEQQTAELRTRRVRAAAQLEAHGGDGLQERADAAAASAEHLQAEQARTDRLAAAAGLLHRLMDERRQAARAAVALPFRQQIESLGRVVFGRDFTVRLGDDLSIAQRTLHGATVDWEHLSTGAREQLAVISRLACAALVAPSSGGAPVVLDDVFGHSDAQRLARVGAVLSLAGRSGQVIVLTASPERFADIGGATVVRMADRLATAGALSVPPASPTAARAPDDEAAAVLECLRAAAEPLGRADLLARTGVGADRWHPVIETLLEQGAVVRSGEKRGTRYRVA